MVLSPFPYNDRKKIPLKGSEYMKAYDLIVLGFGKAGKTLAKDFALQGKKVAVIEQSAQMYGGACINVACIPTKILLKESLRSGSFLQAISRKFSAVNTLNQINYQNLDKLDNVDLYTYQAKFKSDTEILLYDADETIVDSLTADHIIINTGSRTKIPEIAGIHDASHIYDSTGIMNLARQPQKLIIVGAGYVALEFATIFSHLGTDVTLVHNKAHILGQEDREIASALYDNLIKQGIKFVDEAEITTFEDQGQQTVVHTTQGNLSADAILLATGRVPDTDFGLEATSLKTGQHGELIVNQHLQTSVEHIYAVGDIKGGPQFTYISLDDYRIVKSHLVGDGSRTTETRGLVPYSLFVDPPLSRIGLTASAARKAGHTIVEGALAVSSMPRHFIDDDERGLFKVVVDAETQAILGASLYGNASEELINMIKTVTDHNLPYTTLRDQIFTHPTMAESFNDLFNI